MAYDRVNASPSDEAHEAAESLDAVYEALQDGIGFNDLTALFKIQGFLNYIIVPNKGEMISRILQIVSLVERDNSLASQLVPAGE